MSGRRTNSAIANEYRYSFPRWNQNTVSNTYVTSIALGRSHFLSSLIVIRYARIAKVIYLHVNIYIYLHIN